MIRNFFNWLEDWSFNDPNMFIGLGKLLLIITIALAILLSPLYCYFERENDKAIKQCNEMGGTWSVVGSHLQTTLMPVGKVYVPQTHRVTDYGCIVKRD